MTEIIDKTNTWMKCEEAVAVLIRVAAASGTRQTSPFIILFFVFFFFFSNPSETKA